MKRTLRIKRFDPERDKKPRFQQIELEVKPRWTILDALNEIKWHRDGTLAFRRSCRSAICGSCAMTINGKNRLACNTQLGALKGVITVEPLTAFPVIKDLIVDMDNFLDRFEAVKPWLICDHSQGDREQPQSPENHRKIEEAANCILCGSCTSSCPSYWYNKEYLGPAALYKAYRFIFDSRDDGKAERLEIIDDSLGAWRCHTIFNCVDACPKNLNPTEGISEIKKAAVSRKI